MNDETKMDADINGRQRGISGQVIRRCPLVAGGTLYIPPRPESYRPE